MKAPPALPAFLPGHSFSNYLVLVKPHSSTSGSCPALVPSGAVHFSGGAVQTVAGNQRAVCSNTSTGRNLRTPAELAAKKTMPVIEMVQLAGSASWRWHISMFVHCHAGQHGAFQRDVSAWAGRVRFLLFFWSEKLLAFTVLLVRRTKNQTPIGSPVAMSRV